MSLDRFVAFARTQVSRAYRPTPAPTGPPTPARDRTPTAPILPVGQVRQVAPRTAPIPLPATYPDALPPVLEDTATAFTLAAQGRLSVHGLRIVLEAEGGLWYRMGLRGTLLADAVRYLQHWESYYAELMEADCPPGMRCPEVGLCPWHRKTLRAWFDRLHPVVRAAADPRMFEATVAPLIRDLPTTTRSS